MVDWVNGFILPIVELTFIGAIVITLGFIIIRGLWKYYTMSWKWFFKYKVFRNKYDAKMVQWVLDAIERDMGYFDTKKYLMIKGVPMIQVKETMWIYDKVFREMKGGENGQRIARSNSKAKPTETSSYKTY